MGENNLQKNSEEDNMREINITDIEDYRIGHAQNQQAATGCTVIIAAGGATAGVDVRGGAPGTRETDLLDPRNLVEKIQAVVLSGGSAYGLEAASGVMKYLEERGEGFDAGVARVPIVCGAVLFDLAVGDWQVRPDIAMGYQACLNSSEETCAEGNVGAGTGATVGKLLGMERAMKGGFGTFAVQHGELKIGAAVAVNCLGDVVDPRTGEILAGVLDEDRQGLAGTERLMLQALAKRQEYFSGNTTIGVVITNASLSKARANKIASIAQNGYARSIIPVHSMVDGDTIFTMASGKVEADINLVGLLAARTVERAVIRAVKAASPAYGFPSHSGI